MQVKRTARTRVIPGTVEYVVLVCRVSCVY
jgi:hypothetical protein